MTAEQIRKTVAARAGLRESDRRVETFMNLLANLVEAGTRADQRAVFDAILRYGRLYGFCTTQEEVFSLFEDPHNTTQEKAMTPAKTAERELKNMRKSLRTHVVILNNFSLVSHRGWRITKDGRMTPQEISDALFELDEIATKNGGRAN